MKLFTLRSAAEPSLLLLPWWHPTRTAPKRDCSLARVDFYGAEGAAAFFAKLNELAETTGFEIEESSCGLAFRWWLRERKVWRYTSRVDSGPAVAAASALSGER